MPAKKTSTKRPASRTKKTVAKKTAVSSVSKKPNVVVETKKTKSASGCSFKWFEWFMKILILVLLLWNLLISALSFVKKDWAIELEELKVWGSENFEKVIELYNSDMYKAQQKAAIEQFAWQQ